MANSTEVLNKLADKRQAVLDTLVDYGLSKDDAVDFVVDLSTAVQSDAFCNRSARTLDTIITFLGTQVRR